VPKSSSCRLFLAATLLTVVAGCGGGGGGESTPPTPPPIAAPPVTKAEAFRFLNQATFGATEAEAQRLIGLGDSSNAYARWIDEQIAATASLQLPTVLEAYNAPTRPANNPGIVHNDRVEIWLRNAVRSPDQLRQRVAFALSEIMVVSQASSLQGLPLSTTDYYDMLARNAFGDFRRLLEEVTLHPAMGVYLSMLGNQKPDAARNIRPDENYARELMQLFSIGLLELNPDGSSKRDAQNQPIPTYNQAIIEGFANVFTGWKWAWTLTGTPNFNAVRANAQNQVMPMQAYAEQHSTGSKLLLSNVTLPAGQTPQKDLADALDNIFAHPNIAPFICKQLIQRLVTSNPSAAYIARISARFENDGNGRRGNLGAVVKAILLDQEARNASANATAGKLKEPLLRLTQLWRAYDARAANGKYIFQPANVFGQGPQQAPSVFNFFSPFYAPPGEIANQNLVAPEAQIATEFLNTSVTNYLYAQVFNRNSFAAGLTETQIFIDTSAEQALIADSEALVNKIAGKLLGGEISATLKAEAKALLERRAATDNFRVSEALYLIVTSPEYALQR
jgi:uncharacterized protein (DUF1800 family)